MSECDGTDAERRIITEANVTAADGTRNRSLIIDESGVFSDDSC